MTRIGGIVLCGGESTRMGRPKMSLPFGPETMLQRVVRIVSSVVNPVTVVAAPTQTLPNLPEDVSVTYDDIPGMGPLAGLAAGLSRLKRENVEAAYVSSCDVPLLKPEFIRTLVEQIDSCELVIVRDGRYYHPLAAVYRVDVLDRVRQLLDENRLRPIFLIESVKTICLDPETLRNVDPELHSLQNLNTPEDYQQALQDAGLDDSTLD
ncbi:MAG: hypothetical protein Tsb009_05170 [Planctomycetaceae bacterium]